MAKILSREVCNKIKELRTKFSKYADKGWMAEGNDSIEGFCGVLFNNDTDEYFYYNESGEFTQATLTTTSYDEVIEMAKIEGEIAKLCWC